MDYQKHYEHLISRARSRVLECYSEKHHVVPRCLGGSDELSNLVRLTPEEHYVAHQLLVKIHPFHRGLVQAAVMMRANRPGNKLYGWLRRRASEIAKQKVGNKNSQYGSFWMNDGTVNRKIHGDIPEGWVSGRIRSPKVCRSCKNPFIQVGQERNCSEECRELSSSSTASIFIRNNQELLIGKFRETGSINKTLNFYGFSGRQGNGVLSHILKQNGISILKRRNSSPL